MSLLEFITKLESNSGYCAQFTEDPDATMTAAGLSPADREIMESRDNDRIGPAVGRTSGGGQYSNCYCC